MYTIHTYIHVCVWGLRRYGHSGRYILSTMYIIMLPEPPPPPPNIPFRGAPTYGTRTVINLWLYRVEINEPQYVITYVRNEHGVEIRFSGTAACVLPGSLRFSCLLNNNFSGLVTACKPFCFTETRNMGYLLPLPTYYDTVCDIITANDVYYNNINIIYNL